MRKLLLAATALLALTGASRADFVAINDLSFFALNLNNENVGATNSSGVDDGDTIGIASTRANGINLTATGELFTTASGNATIKPDHGVVLDTLTFTPGAGFNFTSFSTRGQLETAGLVTITVNDNLGQSFTFTEPKDADFSPIGVEAIAGSGEFITSVTVSTLVSGGFKEVKQESFGFGLSPAVAAVPEASTWAMLIMGFAGIGLMGMRQRGRKFRLV